MNEFGLTFHHMGLALKKEEEALKFLTGLGYDEGMRFYDPEQKVNLRLCTAAKKPAVELITKGEEEGPLDNILKKYNELIYHTCYETDDLEKSLAAIEARELRVIPVSSPKPAILFGGRHVSFYTIMGFGLIEILEQ
ncbi:MAG: VOC family protein [Alphaproteobacteria bacterium]|nr:VOC family protein [Alphaproteobacteria bacterium]NCQ87688.1 VOC family protein [Alphaproteobacteria bacterium]NCT05803.1 VOC family protein [Alphaproteobacteria bacterium]